jgi:hypothetical protein
LIHEITRDRGNSRMKNIGKRFELKVYSQLHNQKESFGFLKTKNGWVISSGWYGEVESHANGSPGIVFPLEVNLVSYPVNLGGFLIGIWKASNTESTTEVQERFDELGEWISTTEENRPYYPEED